MRAISAALVLLSGVALLSTALALHRHTDDKVAGIGGLVVALIGLVAWGVAFLRDGRGGGPPPG